MGDGPAAARIPNEAPQQLKDFVACVATSVELDTDSLGWLPSGGLGDAAPSITMTPGASPTEARIRVGWEFIGIDLPASIGANGELVVDTSDLPGIAAEVKDGIDEWVDAFNATMAANGKRLDRFEIDGTKATITKRAIVAATPPDPTAVMPAVGGAAAAGETTPVPEIDEPKDSQWGCVAWALGVLVAVGVGLGIFLATRDGGTDDVATSVVPTDAPPTATDAPPATGSPATDVAPATDAVETTQPPPTTEPPPATTEPPPATTEPPPATTEPPPATETDEERIRRIKAELQRMADESVFNTPLFGFPKAGPYRTVDCSTGEPADNLGPEIFGIVGGSDGPSNEVFVLMNLPPMQTAEDFSFAVLLLTLTADAQQQSFQWEVHDDEQRIGELDENRNLLPDSPAMISLEDNGVRFVFPANPDNPLAIVTAQAFNTPAEGDVLACDQALAVAIDSPLPPSSVAGTCSPDATTGCVNNNRFAVTFAGPNGPLPVAESPFDDTVVLGSGDEAGEVRVINGCGFNETFWVFAETLPSVEYDLKITDTVSGETKAYDDSTVGVFPAVTDTDAFATCP